MRKEYQNQPKFADLINELRDFHSPRGQGDVVLLRPGHYGFVECTGSDVQEAITVLERAAVMSSINGPLNALEKIAVRLLMEGAGYNPYNGERL